MAEKRIIPDGVRQGNITLEKKQVEIMLEETTRELVHFKAALDEHAIVAITDAKGKITYVNDKLCTISQYSRQELLGQDHRILNSGAHPKSFFIDLWKTIKAGHPWNGNIKNKKKDGSFYWVHTTIVPFIGEDGKPEKFIAVRADITRQKELEGMLVEVAERERISIGQDIHDDLCQRLAAIKLKCDRIASSCDLKNTPLSKALEQLVNEIGDATHLSRNIAKGLSPISMGEEGLSIGLEELAFQAEQRYKIPCHLHCPEKISFTNSTTAIHVFRIAQELVTNAAKHGQASSIQIHLHHDTRGVLLEVTNDGLPFSGRTKKDPKNTGLGIHYMRYRAETIGASLDFIPSKEKLGGTRVVCTIPPEKVSIPCPPLFPPSPH